MVCIQCGQDTQVTNSRHQKRSNQVWRRRQCRVCGLVFTTEEKIDYSASWRVRDTNGQLRPFAPLKLTLSLYRSLGHRSTALEDASQLAQTIIHKLPVQLGVIEQATITQTTLVALRRFDKAACTHYEAHHSHRMV